MASQMFLIWTYIDMTPNFGLKSSCVRDSVCMSLFLFFLILLHQRTQCCEKQARSQALPGELAITFRPLRTTKWCVNELKMNSEEYFHGISSMAMHFFKWCKWAMLNWFSILEYGAQQDLVLMTQSIIHRVCQTGLDLCQPGSVAKLTKRTCAPTLEAGRPVQGPPALTARLVQGK